MNNKNELLEKDQNIDIETEEEKKLPTKAINIQNDPEVTTQEINSYNKEIHTFTYILKSMLITLITILILAFGIFTIYNMFNTNIINGISIKGFNVSGISKSDARYQLDNYLSSKLPEEIKVKHGEFEATISLSQIEAKFDTKTATENAFKIGRMNNPIKNNFTVLSTMFANINIEPNIALNNQQLTKNLEEISTQLPDTVIQSSYYQDGNELIITSGKEGYIVDIESTIRTLKSSISDFSCLNTPIELSVISKQPEKIDIEKIYNEIKKEPVDAYYTKEPFTIYPSENGLDFNISLDDAKNIISNEQKEEYSIPLKIITPNVTTNMIGTEAFPDQLSNFSTTYAASNISRTTNLKLAASKINGTVLMPGEVFSYNKVVGARTIAAGYKEAPIYVSGKVVDGLGGGICQVTSTIYNAIVYANLEIVQRTNHQFIPSYVTASRDATVVYGSIDFQFKNNRNYPIKINCSVSNGIASCQIFGLRQEDDCEVEISSYQTGKTATAIYSEAYKILKKDGKIIDKVLLSKDTYKRH